jgi:hypothetical protein
MFPSAVNALQFFDSRRMNRTGINAYFQGTDANVLNKTASGIAQLTSSAAQRVEMIARLFAYGVERLFMITHRLYIQHGHRSDVVKLRNQWVEINPSEWKRRTDVKITVGLGTGNKEGQIANLMQQFQAQMAVLPMGIAQPVNIYRTLIEIAKASGSTNPQSFYTDPSTIQPPQPQPPESVMVEQMRQQGAQQLEQMKQQADAQQMKAEQQFNHWKAQFDAETKKWVEQLQAQTTLQVEQMRTGTTKEVELTKVISGEQIKKAELDQNAILKQVDRQDSAEDRAVKFQIEGARMQQAQQDSALNGSKNEVSKTTELLAKAIDRMSKPKQIVRDESGRVTGVKSVE